MAESDVLVIPRGAKHPEAAWEFIKYANTNNPHARSLAELKGIELTCYLQAKNSPLRVWSPFFAKHHPHPHIDVFRRLSASPHAVCVPRLGVWQEYNREFIAAFQKICTLAATPRDALAYCQARMTGSWARYRRSLERHGQISSRRPAVAASSPLDPTTP
jgi:spermidine/putrescine-binding protein